MGGRENGRAWVIDSCERSSRVLWDPTIHYSHQSNENPEKLTFSDLNSISLPVKEAKSESCWVDENFELGWLWMSDSDPATH